MATPQYILDLRRMIGTATLLLPGVTAVVVRDDLEPGRQHLLLNRRTDNGRWSLPSGIVEPGEQPAAAIVREVAEETGVVARADRLARLTAEPEFSYANGDRVQYIDMCFRCRYLEGEAVVADDESTAVAWFATEELPDDLGPAQLRRIECALADQEATVFDR